MRTHERMYEETRQRIAALVAGFGTESAGVVPAPACPNWSVHDVLSHVTGNCADILSGNIAGAATDAWTAAQVDSRRDHTTAEVLEEWDKLGPEVAGFMDDFPGRLGVQLVGDLTVHEHDIRGALDQPGARDSNALEAALDFLIDVMLHAQMVRLGLGPLEVRAGDRSWTVGTGEPASGEPDEWRDEVMAPERLQVASVPAVARVVADPFELFRAAAGRRSREQICAFDWSTDPAPYLAAFDSSPFSLRPTDLRE